MAFLQKLFGSNDREVRRYLPLVEKINAFEESMASLSDDALLGKAEEFRARLAEGSTLDDLLPEAYAVVREVARRVIGERHYDVQLLGGIVLHQGRIAEMKTGEGKTLTSTLPIYLNALAGKGVHVVTVNDYLAKRDANWMGRVYEALGLSTACIVGQGVSYRYTSAVIDTDEVSIEMQNLLPITRREAYAADITYGTNNEFGFDYLRDNMVTSLEGMVQRELNFAIVDEVDSILIDEARTPLIISAPDAESTELYMRFAKAVPQLTPEIDYVIDEKMRVVTLTDAGISHIESILGMKDLYGSGNIRYVHHLEQSLKAYAIFARDRDYVVKDGEVIIVDDFTGRLMPGRRYSEGLHQAIEAKEGVKVQRESRTLATITFQNYFRLYAKLSGMTGTAMTSAEEFAKVYKLDAIEIPTNKTLARRDLGDVIYKTEAAKFRAIAGRVRELNASGQPVLIGTIAIEKSELLSQMLTREGISHEVLNAKNHEREASIVASAGKRGSVTIATNMAGRGTDIKLDQGAKEAGGLFILGTERHEARRIDNQLRGRAGRQGDPGVSQFFVSLEDELLRRFGGERLKNMMTSLGLPEDEPIQNRLISKTIESAQTRIEGYNFDIRKHVLEYDDVMNKQREVIYRKRRSILEAEDMRAETESMLEEELDALVGFHTAGDEGEWRIAEIITEVNGLAPGLDEKRAEEEMRRLMDDRSLDEPEKREATREYLMGHLRAILAAKSEHFGPEAWPSLQKGLYLRSLDTLWMNHLDEIDYLRQGIGLRGLAQRDPLIEYKREAYDMFLGLLNSVRKTFLGALLKIEAVTVPQPEEQKNLRMSGPSDVITQFEGKAEGGSGDAAKPAPIVNEGELIGRNDPCPCGSGKKYKKCGMIGAPEHTARA